MSIKFQILGNPGKDNALMVWVNSGSKYFRLLFDCGENLLHNISQNDVRSIDYLFFSHLHIDHVSGFDYFFRRNYDRASKPVFIWGPDYTTKAIQHRMLGYKWNLVNDLPGEWFVSDINNNITTNLFKTCEGFSLKHLVEKSSFNRVVFSNEYFRVSAVILNHGIPSIGFRVDENPSININQNKLDESGLIQGAWLEKVKDPTIGDNEIIEVNGEKLTAKELRENLLIQTKGDSIAYLTDFGYDEKSVEDAVKLVRDCGTVICESQYAKDDIELAEKNFHLTSTQSAEIAKKANAGKLILFHISERYSLPDGYLQILNEAKIIFPETFFPEHWMKEF